MVPVEGALVGRHRRVVLPRLRDHHQHGVPDRPPGEVQQLEALVEARGVGRARRDDRERALETRDQRRGHQRLAGAHPVAVALHRVDLAVVREVPVRVRERPRRERVGGEPAVHQRERGLDALVGEVGEELGQLGRGEHALVDEGAARQRREVHLFAVDARELVLAALAHHEQLAVELDAGRAGGVVDEELPEARHHAQRGGADHRGVDRGLAPADHAEALVLHDGVDAGHRLLGRFGVERQEREADAVGARGRQREVDHGPQEPVGDLEQDPGAVAGVDLGARRAPVVEVAERVEGVGDDRAAGHALDVADERDPAGVVLEARVVEPERLGHRAERPPRASRRSVRIDRASSSHIHADSARRTGGRRGTTLALAAEGTD